MQHAAAVFEHQHAGGLQLGVVGARGGADDARVAALGHHQLDLHPAQRGVGQRHQRRLGGHEVGRGQPDALARQVQRVDHRAVHAFHVGVGPGGDDLDRQAAGRLLGQQVRVVAGRATFGVVPVLEEHILQPAHGAATDQQVGVAVGVVRAHLLVLVVGQVDAADEARVAVDHHDLAVGAQVDQRAQAVQPSRVEHRQLAARGAQLVQQRAAVARQQPGRADGVHQQPHLHAGAGALGQRLQQAGAGAVRFEDVVLQVDVAARLRHLAQQRLQRGAAAGQQLHAVRARRCDAAGGLDQPGVLARPQRRRRLPGAERRQIGLRHQHRLLVPALEALAPHPARAEVVVDHQPQHRHQVQHHDPGQRGHRRAALQHDPGGQHHARQRPGPAQPEGPGVPEQHGVGQVHGRGAKGGVTRGRVAAASRRPRSRP